MFEKKFIVLLTFVNFSCIHCEELTILLTTKK